MSASGERRRTARRTAWRIVRGRTAALAALALAPVGGAACVAIDTAPGGVASLRFDPLPPSIEIGDTLRDTLGAVLPLRGVAFDADDRPVATASLRYAAVPLTRDSVTQRVDTALAVDTLTGLVRATATWVAPQGRVAVRAGDRLQLLDTLAIVPRPDSLVRVAGRLPGFLYDCRDTTSTLDATLSDTGVAARAIGNATGPMAVVVRGDSAGVRGPVRRWLVRWSIVSPAPATIPIVTLPRSVATVPAIAVISGTADRLVRWDTTDGAGRSTTRLRIRPFALGRAAFPPDSFDVVVRAEAFRRGQRLDSAPEFRIALRRAPAAPGQPTTCQ